MSAPLTIDRTVLQGEVVRLEPYQPKDFDEVARAALTAPEIFRFIPSRMQDMGDLRARFSMAEQLMEGGKVVFFLTRLAKTGEVVGSTSSMVTDAAHRRIEIGFTWLLPRAQRTAANTEAKLLQLTQAFEASGAIRVEFKTDARNTRSRDAILRIGAREEGTLRSHMICWDGHLRDSVYFSIIASEWPDVKSRLMAKLARR